MEKLTIESFKVIGISVRTTNKNNQVAKDIGDLWGRFINDKVLEAIPNKIDNTIYSIYTDYESDHTKPYTTILGCKVKNLDTIPVGMVGKSIKGGNYVKFSTKGDLMKDLVINKWFEIWEMDLNRLFTADFEVFGEKAQNPADAEIDILIAIK
ncbi:AraC family transcriptional regulator [Pedobacter chinensis]|jgi:predicted transcriptional regulator YdeE|uniref:Predicted transcriptional regulator YdeE, contains AraC-type DNA-binding domain n=3 Tax=Bacteroidota TaxID=976 RepID=A0A1N7QA32_9FLAO|nr:MULTISPECIES: GyrI-like domain-containing protein [Bacteroidota]MDV3710598.1 AraC family transcriptional regulator [Elizabethkingia anophelis]KQB98897.1 transcriptional regulator [Pedobacter sp. Hv1]MDV3765725.1 AraC family transcriptional regulator [Elizabethkingia anophelis]RDC55214.1 AraC family transcriptional regulator [Pedobacter chinensis]SIT19733.1 Predicted transcriptional regulator YdeE, contains AraC-type DNA-binding domain [Chryseobacterium ureilyticum]